MELSLTIYDKFILEKFLIQFNDNLIENISQVEADFVLKILRRDEENECSYRDQFGNYEFSFTKEEYRKPYLDFYIHDLLNKYGLVKKKLWGEHPFAFILSHDVDLVNKNHFKQDFRASLKFLVKGKGIEKLRFLLHFALIFRNILVRIKKNGDTIWGYEKWIDLEKIYSFTSTYFIFVTPKLKDLHKYDCDFLLTDMFRFRGRMINVVQFLKEILESGSEIGLHGSYHAAKNSLLIKDQLSSLQNSVANSITSYRNHYLQFDSLVTPAELSKTEIEVDSSLGFNRDIGFRAGTCYPFYFFNQNMTKPILEVSQLIMDSALFLSNSLELDVNLAKSKIIEIMDRVEEVGGIFTVNYHPDKVSRQNYIDTYEFILNELKRRNAKCLSHLMLMPS